MENRKTAAQFARMCKDTAQNYQTLYVMGCFGAPLVGRNVSRYCENHEYNRQPHRQEKIRQAADRKPPVFGFDCVCFIKGLLWGWNGDGDAVYGGAQYKAGGVPDIGTEQMIARCLEVTEDFDRIQIGEAVWLPGHIGIYVGDGLVVECSPKWDDCVQITACNRDIPGYHRRDWVKHGKLPYVSYEEEKEVPDMPELEKGSQGGEVKAMQALLIGYGYDFAGYDADGIFGDVTERALKAYQRENGVTPDGICGKLTWERLLGRV